VYCGKQHRVRSTLSLKPGAWCDHIEPLSMGQATAYVDSDKALRHTPRVQEQTEANNLLASSSAPAVSTG